MNPDQCHPNVDGCDGRFDVEDGSLDPSTTAAVAAGALETTQILALDLCKDDWWCAVDETEAAMGADEAVRILGSVRRSDVDNGEIHSDARRRDTRRPEVLMDEVPDSAVMPAQEGTVWAKRAHARPVNALERLDEEPRRVFILFEIEQLATEEIAKETGTPVRTCYARLEVARDQVRAELKRHETQSQKHGKKEVSR